jgi:type IV pilus biogenesis protein CpaD/CtpE
MISSRLPLRLAVLAIAGVALAACETTGSGPQASVAAAPQQPMTHTEAAMECWMGTEKSDARMNLDKRADIVDRCIARKMKGAPAPGN